MAAIGRNKPDGGQGTEAQTRRGPRPGPLMEFFDTKIVLPGHLARQHVTRIPRENGDTRLLGLCGDGGAQRTPPWKNARRFASGSAGDS